MLKLSHKISHSILLGIFILSLAGCHSDNAMNETNDQTKSLLPSVDTSEIVATVSGQKITQDDLDAAIDKTFGEYATTQINQDISKKVLQSLVMSKAMAMKEQASLTSEELKDIERDVSSYREELLTKKYLQDNISQIPVSQAMIEEYYHQHPERFAANTIRSFEMVQSLVNTAGDARDQAIDKLKMFNTDNDWSSTVSKLKQQGIQFKYSKGASSDGVLDKEINNILVGLKPKQVSSVYFIDGYPTVMRLNKLVETSPKPLQQVENDIRKMLLPVQLKQAISKASKELLATQKVIYFGEFSSN